MCTLANEATETHCLACGNARPAVATAMAGSAPSPLPDSTSGAAGGRDESQLRETLQSMQDAATCPVCLDQAKNMVFQCGHQTCSTCGPTLTACPIWYGILLLLLALRYCFYYALSHPPVVALLLSSVVQLSQLESRCLDDRKGAEEGGRKGMTFFSHFVELENTICRFVTTSCTSTPLRLVNAAD